MTDLQAMLDRLRNRATDQVTRDLIAAVAADSVNLAAKAAMGEDVAAEVRQVAAQTANLGAEMSSAVRNEVLAFLTETVRAIVFGAIPGPTS